VVENQLRGEEREGGTWKTQLSLVSLAAMGSAQGHMWIYLHPVV